MLNNFSNTNSIHTIIFLIIGGLSLFLFGLNLTKENLKTLASKKLEKIIRFSTDTTLKAFLVGIISTILIQSSSGITAIVVAFIASGYLSFKQGLAIMIGSNIGTCATAFLLGFNIEESSLIIISTASIFIFLSKKESSLYLSQALLGIGFIFLGLQFMGVGFENIAKSKNFISFMMKYANSFPIAFFFGIIVTFLIQSSSAIIGLLEQIYAANLISLSSSIAILLGSNIGTTLTGYIATIKTNYEASKAVTANVLFNLLGSLLFIIILPIFKYIINSLISLNIANTKELTIAFSHLIFNISTGLLAYIFFEYLIKLTLLLYPKDKKIISFQR